MDIRTEPGRLKQVAQGLIVVAAVVGLVGLGRFSLTPEARINAAFPPPPARAAQVSDALATLPLGQRKLVGDELASRVKLRALTCAKGYTPGWGTSLDEIRRNIADTACFANADAEIDSWLGLVRVAHLLAQPPLRRLPVKPVFPAREPIVDVMVAERAGVAWVVHKEGASLVDLNTGEVLRRADRNMSSVGKFSPNGQVYSVTDGEATEFRSTLDGVLVARLPGVREYRFQWLDERTAVYIADEARAARLLDFRSLKEVELPGADDINGVRPVPGKPDQFVVAHRHRATLFQVDRSAEVPRVTALRFIRHPAFSWSLNHSSATADGRHYVNGTSALEIFNVEHMRLESVNTGEFLPRIVLGTHDPDLVFIEGGLRNLKADRLPCYLYSISRHSFAPVACKAFRERFAYLPAFKALARFEDGRIELRPFLDPGQEVSHFDQVRAWYEASVGPSQEQRERIRVAAMVGSFDHAPPPLLPGKGDRELYKCRMPEGGYRFQAQPCPGGTVVPLPGGGQNRDESARRREQALQQWRAQRDAEQQRREAMERAERDALARAVPNGFRYVAPEIIESEPVPVDKAAQQRCPYTPVTGEDIDLEMEKMRLHASLFYVDPWKYSTAAAPAAGENRIAEDTRRQRCSLLVDDYHAIGNELLRVHPKSLPAVRECFRQQAQRLDAEGLRLGCQIERVVKLRE